MGEFYNSNPNNPYEQNVREPVAGTVRRTANGILPYRLGKDDIEAASEMQNPFPETEEVIAEGKVYYEMYCDHCHGASGQADGPVAAVFGGVPPYNKGNTKNLSEGHVFHVITHGIRRMGAHGSQISQDKRWKIVKYVKQLQNQ